MKTVKNMTVIALALALALATGCVGPKKRTKKETFPAPNLDARAAPAKAEPQNSPPPAQAPAPLQSQPVARPTPANWVPHDTNPAVGFLLRADMKNTEAFVSGPLESADQFADNIRQRARSLVKLQDMKPTPFRNAAIAYLQKEDEAIKCLLAFAVVLAAVNETIKDANEDGLSKEAILRNVLPKVRRVAGDLRNTFIEAMTLEEQTLAVAEGAGQAFHPYFRRHWGEVVVLLDRFASMDL